MQSTGTRPMCSSESRPRGAGCASLQTAASPPPPPQGRDHLDRHCDGPPRVGRPRAHPRRSDHGERLCAGVGGGASTGVHGSASRGANADARAQVTGYAGRAPTFPRVAGNEGVGVVEEVAAGATGLKKGDFVVASRAGVGTWATHAVAPEDAWTKLEGDAPGGAAFPIEHAAVAVAAPLTAQGLLASAGPLAAGSVVVQNDASTLVGQSVVQYAAAAGLKTVNIAPAATADWDNFVYHLQAREGAAGAAGVSRPRVRTPDTRPAPPSPAAGPRGVAGRQRRLRAHARLHEAPRGRARAGAGHQRRGRRPLHGSGPCARPVCDARDLRCLHAPASPRHARPLHAAVRSAPPSPPPRAQPPPTHSADVTPPTPLCSDLRFRGFNVDAYLRSLSKVERDAAVRAAVGLLRGGDKGACERVCLLALRGARTQRRPPVCLPSAASRLKLLLARESFSDFGVALKRSLVKGERTVVLTMQ